MVAVGRLMISVVIIAYNGEDYSAVLDQAKLLAKDILILTMNNDGYTIIQHNSGRVLSPFNLLKGYGELLKECIDNAEGEYILFLKSGDRIKSSNILGIKESCQAYYAEVFEDRYEGTVRYSEPRIFKRGISLKGRYQLENVDNVIGCGLSIHSTSYNERSFLKEWIEKEHEDSYGWDEEYLLAECCYILGQYNDACSHYKRIYNLKEFKPSYDIYRDMCWAFIAGECFSDVMSVIEKATKAYPEGMELYYISAVIYGELGEYRRCASDLKKIFESTGKEAKKELTEYNGLRSSLLMAEALYAIEEYKSAAFYYRKCILEKPEDKQLMLNLCSSLQLSGLCQKEIEEYLNKELAMCYYDVCEAMAEYYMYLRKWDMAEEYARQLQGARALEVQVESLYHFKSYRLCLYQISYSSLVESEYYSIMGLCCMLLDGAIPIDIARDFIVKLKNKGAVEILHAYDYFMGTGRLSCSGKLLQEFSEMLLETGDSSCIKYIRQAMDENNNMDFMRLLKKAFVSRLYYFCEEIINIYYSEGRYEYEVMRILAYVYFYTGKLSECERYISYALIIKKSTDLVRLGCMCKLRECREFIKNNENSMEVKSIQRLLNTISEYENILTLN